jgi:hypothetical protein
LRRAAASAIFVLTCVAAIGCVSHPPRQEAAVPAGGSSTPATASPALDTAATETTTGSSIALPRLIGMRKADVATLLESLGLLYEVVPNGPPADDLVVGQRPAPGAVVRPGAVVGVRARCYPAPCPNPFPRTIYDPCTCDAR